MALDPACGVCQPREPALGGWLVLASQAAPAVRDSKKAVTILLRSAVARHGSGGTPMQLEVSQTVPLTQWDDGAISVTGTCVTLDVIVNQCKLGATAEQIHDSFPTASLKDVCGGRHTSMGGKPARESWTSGTVTGPAAASHARLNGAMLRLRSFVAC